MPKPSFRKLFAAVLDPGQANSARLQPGLSVTAKVALEDR
jgi:hypothetical protein